MNHRRSYRRGIAWVAAGACTVGLAQALRAQGYVGLSAGVALQPFALGVRSDNGVDLAASVGRGVAPHTAVEARISIDRFARPLAFISPGGCLGGSPCNPPVPEEDRYATASGEIIWGGAIDRTMPMIIGGFGVRYASSDAGHNEWRPQIEAGAGMISPLGHTRLSIEARYQRSATTAAFPNWTVPISLTIRF